MAVTQAVDLVILQGETFNQTILYYNTDLTGFVGKAQMRERASADSPIVAEFEVVIDATVPLESTVTIALSSAATAAIPVTGSIYKEYKTYVYDVIAYLDSEPYTTYRVANGTVKVSPSTTKRY